MILFITTAVKISNPTEMVVFSTTAGPAVRPTNRYRGLFYPGVKRPGREADHSPPSNDEFENSRSYISTTP
jgi:hypothetical protein